VKPARELRFAFIFDDYDAALHLFHDVFGLETMMEFGHHDGKGVILKIPSATLEVFNREYGHFVDDVEVGRPLDYRVRIAIKIDDLTKATEAVRAAGASPISEPVDTPWGDRNRRFTTSDGLQMTLFESQEK
jgi:predicted enzyme related to lactoylglutathione lyase